MKVTSPAFHHGAAIPQRYGCGNGRNYRKPSIPLKWEHVPVGTQSFVLLMDDPHPVARHWVHWLVVDLPRDCRGLPEGISGKDMPPTACELPNTWGERGYGGPCPPSGSHTYRIQVFALAEENCTLKLESRKSRSWTPACAGVTA